MKLIGSKRQKYVETCCTLVILETTQVFPWNGTVTSWKPKEEDGDGCGEGKQLRWVRVRVRVLMGHVLVK